MTEDDVLEENREKADLTRCSFCAKLDSEVFHVVQGPWARICDECVFQCADILKALECPGFV